FRAAIRWAPEERAAVVAALAEGDVVVRDEVLSLLAHHHEPPLHEPAPRDPLGAVGVVLDRRYRVEALVHAGRHRSVYRAEHLIERRPVALTFFPEALDRFAPLAALATRARAIVRPVEAGTWASPAGPRRFMVLEWLDGRTLAEQQRADRAAGLAVGWPLERVVQTLDPVAEALAVAADHSLIHGAVRMSHVVL